MLEMTNLRICIAFVIVTTVLTVTNKISAENIGRTAKSSENCKGSKNGNEYCPQEDILMGSECPPYLFPDSGEGPFFLLDQPVRSDVTEGTPGIPLVLSLKVTEGNATWCTPLKNASVHIWHANASGIYSAYLGYYPMGRPESKPIRGGHVEPSDTTTFLRGIQYTNENGEVTFKTIYPGWYHGRSLHLHFKIIAEDGIQKLVGEFYFPDDITDMVATVEPYSQNKQERNKNEVDRKFTKYEGGSSMTNPEGTVETGFKCTISIGVKS